MTRGPVKRRVVINPIRQLVISETVHEDFSDIVMPLTVCISDLSVAAVA